MERIEWYERQHAPDCASATARVCAVGSHVRISMFAGDPDARQCLAELVAQLRGGDGLWAKLRSEAAGAYEGVWAERGAGIWSHDELQLAVIFDVQRA